MLKYNNDELKYHLEVLEKLKEKGYKYIARAEHGEVPCPINPSGLVVENVDTCPCFF